MQVVTAASEGPKGQQSLAATDGSVTTAVRVTITTSRHIDPSFPATCHQMPPVGTWRWVVAKAGGRAHGQLAGKGFANQISTCSSWAEICVCCPSALPTWQLLSLCTGGILQQIPPVTSRTSLSKGGAPNQHPPSVREQQPTSLLPPPMPFPQALQPPLVQALLCDHRAGKLRFRQWASQPWASQPAKPGLRAHRHPR